LLHTHGWPYVRVALQTHQARHRVDGSYTISTTCGGKEGSGCGYEGIMRERESEREMRVCEKAYGKKN
jgi:hypothetical protein